MEQAKATAPDLATLGKFYRGLADNSRLAILMSLGDGEQTSGQIAAAAGLSPSNASRHLSCLRDCGLVESRQEWRTVYYRLADGVGALLEHNADVATRLAERIDACENPAMALLGAADIESALEMNLA